MTEQALMLGVNYWPQKTAMFMWREFDKAVMDQDVEIISGLGLSFIRIYLLWEDFQPTPKTVPAIMLDRLVELLETADEKNIKVVVTLFAGHICGLNWLPPWMLLASADRNQSQVFSLGKVRFNRIRNPYAEPDIMESQIYFLGSWQTLYLGTLPFYVGIWAMNLHGGLLLQTTLQLKFGCKR